MTQFIELLESGRREHSEFDASTVSQALVDLRTRCGREGELRAEGVWRLDRGEALQLDREGDRRPCGGWRALCSLAVGTGLLRAEEDAFVPGPRETESFGGGDECRRQLVESFTRWLIPPATAAGMFLAMGIHPLWGLRLARRLHSDAPMLEGSIEDWRDEELLPEADLAELRKGVFASLSIIFSGLRRLRTDERYGQPGLIGFIGEALAFGREQIESSGQGLDVLIDDIGEPKKAISRSREFAAREIFDAVLVPAGVMRRYDDDTFAIDSTLLQNVQVGHLGKDAQRTWFQCFLVDHPCEQVA